MRVPWLTSVRYPALVWAVCMAMAIPQASEAGLAPKKFRKSPIVAPPSPSSDIPVPIVVRPPTPPMDRPTPPEALGTPSPASLPEPSSLRIGLVGAGLAAASWVRRRRGKLAKADAPGDPGEGSCDCGELKTQPI